jgi:hypothetical protein
MESRRQETGALSGTDFVPEYPKYPSSSLFSDPAPSASDSLGKLDRNDILMIWFCDVLSTDPANIE